MHIKNRYVQEVYPEGNDLVLAATSNECWGKILSYLSTNSNLMDSGVSKIVREFHYDSDPADLKIILKGNLPQAIEILSHRQCFFSETEKNDILKQVTSSNSPNIRMKFSKKSGDSEDTVADEKTPLLGK